MAAATLLSMVAVPLLYYVIQGIVEKLTGKADPKEETPSEEEPPLAEEIVASPE